MIRVVVFTLAVIMGRLSSAAMIPNDTSSELRLGHGADPVTDKLYEKCVEFEENEYVGEDLFQKYEDYADLPSRKLEMKVELVTTYDQVDRFTNASISAGVSYAAASGSFSYNKENRYSLESDRAMVGIEAIADYGRWYLKGVKLKSEFLKLYKKDPKMFYSLCGKEYVSGFIAGQGIRILLATEKLSIYSYEKIAMSMSAAYGAGNLSANLDASFLNVAEELSKLGSLSINLLTFGGSEFNSLTKLMESKGDIEEFRKRVAELAKDMESNKAIKVVWITQPYPGVLNEDNKILNDVKRKTLRDLFQTYRHIAGARDRLSLAVNQGMDTHIRPFCGAKYSKECDNYIELMNQRFAALENAVNNIETLYRECVNAESTVECKLPTIEDVNVDFLTQMMWPERYKYELYQRYLDDIANN